MQAAHRIDSVVITAILRADPSIVTAFLPDADRIDRANWAGEIFSVGSEPQRAVVKGAYSGVAPIMAT
jgi:hypothetical protein